MEYICKACGRREPVDTRLPKCPCGGLWSLDFTPPPFDPSLIDRKEWSIFRYRAFMPLKGDGWRDVTLGEGMSPVVTPFEGVHFKVDYTMPTLSFKDRGAAVLIAHCKAIGVDSVVQDSSGNAGNSVAAYSARAGLECEIFVPEGTSPKKIDMIKAHGAKVNIVPGSRDNCANVCRAQVDGRGAYYASHVYNPFFYQGTKTYIYEVYEQMGRIPQNIFIPTGNGTLFLGVVLGLEHLLHSGCIDRMPQIFALQGENCAPLYEAYIDGDNIPKAITPKPTMAEGIAIGVPMRGKEMLAYAAKYGIKFITAPEEGILPARAALAQKGIYCEHTSASAYAAYLSYCAQNGKLEDCLIPITGAGIKSDH